MEHESYESGNGNIKLGWLPGVSGGELTTSVMFNENFVKTTDKHVGLYPQNNSV